jgi:hypothetical protein
MLLGISNLVNGIAIGQVFDLADLSSLFQP